MYRQIFINLVRSFCPDRSNLFTCHFYHSCSQVPSFANYRPIGHTRINVLSNLRPLIWSNIVTSVLDSPSQLHIETSKRTRRSNSQLSTTLITRAGFGLFRSSSSNLSPNPRSRRNLLVRGIKAENRAALDLWVTKLLNDVQSFLGGIHSVRRRLNVARGD